MIGQIMKACNNHFVKTIESCSNPLTSTGIEGTFSNPYFTNQYILIEGTTLNDGVYKLTEVTPSKLTVELEEETPKTPYMIYGLSVPKEFKSLVANIESWVASNGIKNGIASESIDDYSVSFDASNGSPGDWKSAFSTQLNGFRRVYDSKDAVKNRYNVYNKGWF